MSLGSNPRMKNWRGAGIAPIGRRRVICCLVSSMAFGGKSCLAKSMVMPLKPSCGAGGLCNATRSMKRLARGTAQKMLRGNGLRYFTFPQYERVIAWTWLFAWRSDAFKVGATDNAFDPPRAREEPWLLEGG
jgi:hypothetical protein